VTTRDERLAQNEASSREINEQIELAHELIEARAFRILCECAHDHCDRLIAIDRSEYDRVRSDGRWFALTPGHVVDEIEYVVESNDRFVTVQKREGVPAETAEAEDPRT
jgi:hypothetical protein